MSAVKEPLLHILKRDGIHPARALMIRLAAVLASLVVCAVVIVLITGLNPLEVYAGIWDGAVGTNRRMWVTFRDAAILLCIGLAVTPAFRMRFWNIGAEGQTLAGAMAAAAVMIYLRDAPAWAVYALCPLAGVAAGMLWGLLPAVCKARWNTNETLFTLMLNYVATQVVSFGIVYWENPKGSNHVGLINSSGRQGWLPDLAGNGYLLPILIVLTLPALLYIYMNFTKQGYEIAVVGESENTARYAGIRVSRVIVRTMALSGAMAGVAGYLLTCGVGHTISTSLVGGRGFTAIVVAWLAKLNPLAMTLVAFLLVFMQKGANQIATQFGLNENASEILTGIILFFVLGCEFFIRYRVAVRRRGEGVK